MDILIIDDSLAIRTLVQKLLVEFGHHVEMASDGLEAWKKINNKHFQVVISDWMMPNMDGIELTRKIRNQDFVNYIYVILLTGKSAREDLIAGIDAGADDFISKPVDFKELRIRLRSAQRIVDLESSLAAKNTKLAQVNESIKQDLEHAALTQKNALPVPLDNQFIKTSWLYKPAIFVGGDTFNYFFSESGLFIFLSVDISGHGVSSALMSMSLQSMMSHQMQLYGGEINRECAREIPGTFAKNLNDMILNNSFDHYLTMTFGLIDFDTNDLYFVQAGHPYPFYYDSLKDDLKLLQITGYPIGLIDNVEFETKHINILGGDKLILYSDGIAEIKSSLNGRFLDSNNLYGHFNKIRKLPAEQLIRHVEESWLVDGQLENPVDDVSLLVFEFKS